MTIRILSLILLSFLLSETAYTQPSLPAYNPVFDDTVLPTIHISLDEDDLAFILADENSASDQEFPATFIFNNGSIQDTVQNVGFRLRGNTSRQSAKKSFKVSFNTFEPGRKFYDLEKMNLNGEHNDPSIIRSKLSWDLYQRLKIPASRANHVRLFVNNEYRGLYINVEHIDEQFLQSRFGGDDGNLYKNLYPADLAYLGHNREAYLPDESRRPYDLRLKDSDDEGYDDLAHFIDVLNNTPDAGFAHALEEIFDVYGFLQILAVEVATGSWDNYWYLKNNYYLYNNPLTGRFHFIPYDYDNTFGIDFVGGDWGTRDIYNWGHESEARPLVSRIMAINRYRSVFTYYLRRLIDQQFNTDSLFPRIDQLKQLIQAAAETDPYREMDWGFSAEDFDFSYNEALGGHVAYGLKPYITTRVEHSLNQADNVNIAPVLYELSLSVSPTRPAPDNPIALAIDVDDESADLTVIVEYRINNGNWETVTLFDDGRNGDNDAGDGRYGGQIPALQQTGVLDFLISAQDPERNTYILREKSLAIGFPMLPLVINEFMASNSNTIADASGEYDDWVELFNNSDALLPLSGLYLTDNLNIPDKWALPDSTLPANAFILLWIDGDADTQGPLHAPFQLAAEGEAIGIFGQDSDGFYPIDTLSYLIQASDVSMGRTTDGTGGFSVLSTATPGSSNGTGVAIASGPEAFQFSLAPPYPNPSSGTVSIAFEVSDARPVRLAIYDVLGRRVQTLLEGSIAPGAHQLTWDGADSKHRPAATGVYFIQLENIEAGHRAMTQVMRIR